MSRTQNNSKSTRVWELDFIRGTAILFMIFLHLNYVLIYYQDIEILKNTPNIEKIADLLMDYGGTFFIVISGICCCYSKNNLNRGLSLFFVASILTYVTFIFESYIVTDYHSAIFFGVLHFLAVSMIIGHFVLRFIEHSRFKSFFLYSLPFVAVALAISGYVLRSRGFSFPILYGYSIPNIFRSADYFTILPYLGWFILGIFIGKTFYTRGYALFKSERLGNFVIIKGISFIGRKSLYFYLAHQPVIFAILFILESKK